MTATVSLHMNVVVKNTFLEAQEFDDFGDSCRGQTRNRFDSDSGVSYFSSLKTESKLNWDSNTSTSAETDEDSVELVHSDTETNSGTVILPPPGNWDNLLSW